MIEGTTPFLEKAHKVALAIGVASLLFGLVWAVVVDEGESIATHGADGYSRSAIGFKAFGELLQRNGIEVVHSRFRSAERTGPADVLVVAAPELPEAPENDVANPPAGGSFRDALAKAPRILLVLPKWKPKELDPSDPKQLFAPNPATDPFVAKVEPVASKRLEAIVALVAPDAEVVRVSAPTFALDAFAAAPELPDAQLLRDAPLTPLLSGDDGLLVGSMRSGNRPRLILTDPDVLSNGGLALGQNADLALALIDTLRGENGRVVFDETDLHGFERAPSIWRELGRPPLKQGGAHLLLLAIAAVLAGAVRFGTPRRVVGGWREGKQALLDNTAELMELVGHAPSAVARYFDATVERLTESLHAPATLDRPARQAWLATRLTPVHREELAALAGVLAPSEGGGAATSRRSTRSALLALAARIHRFREEVLHGAR